MAYPERRKFIKNSTKALSGLAALPFLDAWSMPSSQNALKTQPAVPPKILARDESYWDEIRKMFRVAPEFVNLENGYYSLTAEPVTDAGVDYLKTVNANHSFYLRREYKEDRVRLLNEVAELAGCSPEELILCRNTTEALDTVIMGLDLKPGDEVIMTDQDYYSVLQCWTMRARRYGSVNKVISIPFHPKSDEEIVAAYERAITPKTKVLMVTHLINTSGQILPVRKIADMAHRHGIEVISDSAHAFAHIDFKIPDLDCDYLGASLHKWLGAPLGTGILYMKKEKIKKVWPLFGDDKYPDDDMRKFGHIGTIPCHNELAITDAIAFHEKIGAKQKEERLRYLATYWRDRVKDIPGVIINTPDQPHRYCAIANVGIKGVDSTQLAEILFEKYNIFTVTKNNQEMNGVRVTPHLYNSLAELDQLVAALKKIANS